MSKKVFISYSRQDYDFVERLVDDLAARGVGTWLDQRDIPAGQRWDNAIQKALRECEFFLVVLSPASVASENVLDEVAYAMGKKKPVFPVLAQECDIPYRLARVQYVDFRHDYGLGLDNLIEDLTRAGVPILEKPGILPEAAPAPAAPKTGQTTPEETRARTEEAEPEPGLLTLTSPVRLELVRVPLGEFLMGSDPEGDEKARLDEQPQHRLFLPEFSISRYLVTNAQYQVYVTSAKARPPDHWEAGKLPSGLEDHPAVLLTWHEAEAFCEWLSGETGKPFRLPSEAEWEKAARGGDGRIFPWGDRFDKRKLNSEEDGPGAPTPVGQYSPGGDSPYGAADMAGNVWEWCADWYEEGEYERHSQGADQDLQGPRAGQFRVLRGGSFLSNAGFVRCAYRGRDLPGDGFRDIGFRVVLSSP